MVMMCDIKFRAYLLLIVFTVVCSNDDSRNFPDEAEFIGIPPSDSMGRKRLIIDTDAGSDDGVAILNILGREELFGDAQVHLITAVSGNTNVDNVATNVLKILKTANRLDIPVYKGANQSLLWTPKIDNFFGEDGFGDFPFEDPPSQDLIKSGHAVNALIEETMVHPGQLSLVCLGPLTNIALAARLHSDFFKNLKEIYVLGGSDSGQGNISPGIEFNFHMDPEAAFIVLKEAEKNRKTVRLLPWETVSLRSLIEMKWRKEVLGVIGSPEVNLINQAERLILTGENWISADAMLSSVVLDDSVIESSGIYSADVEVSGRISRGALFIDYSSLTNQIKNIEIIKKVNVNKFKKMLLQNFNPRGGQYNRASRN